MSHRASAERIGPRQRIRSRGGRRWSPRCSFAALILVRAGTSPLDLVRYALYAGLAVILPGTLVYRALRGRPHTLVDDLAMGAAVGLVLELAGVGALLGAGPSTVRLALARAGRAPVRGRARAAPALAGARVRPGAAGVVVGGRRRGVLLHRVPRGGLPRPQPDHSAVRRTTRQYLDLSYQLSLAGEAKHAFPPGLPQVAGEPLAYHWFAYAHMAMTSMVGHIDLPVVALRLAIPALCALAIVLTAVVGWRVSGRPLVGAVAAALFFAVGEFNFTHPVTLPFGTQVTFVIWHGMSMIYAWVLVIALIAATRWRIARKSSTVDTAAPATTARVARSRSRRCWCSATAGPRAVRLPVVAAGPGDHGGGAAGDPAADPVGARGRRTHLRRRPALRHGGALQLPDVRRGSSAR